MPPEPYPAFSLSRDARVVACARREPVLGWQPASAEDSRERWAAPRKRKPRFGRTGGVSLALHLLALAATLLWASRFTAPTPIDESGAVAMMFAPTEHQALPPAQPIDPQAAPVPLAAATPPSALPPTPETAAVAPPPPSMAMSAAAEPLPAPAPSAEPVQAMAPPPAAPPKPADHPRPPHPAATQLAKASASRPAANAPAAPPTSATASPAAPQRAMAALVPPHPLSAADGNHAPLYPISAARRREQGRVVLDVDVTADGRADAIRIATSSGSPALDRAAIEAVRLWRFNPATRGGTPVPATAEVPINFTLSN